MNNQDVTSKSHPLITPGHRGRKAIIYVRQSSPEQVRENTGSTDFQRSQVDSARAYGWPDHLIELIDEDLGRSGTSTIGRTGWQRILKQIAANEVGAVFSRDISRLARQLGDFEEFRVLASYHGVILITEGRVIDPNDPNDTVLSQVAASFAQYENRKRAETMSLARMTKARQGKVVSLMPTGWIKDPDGKYDYDPAVKDTIQMVIETFWQTRTIRGAVKALNKAGIKIPSRRGKQIIHNKPSLSNVKRILTNPAYTGTYVFGKTKTRPELGTFRSGASAPVKVPEHQWIKIPNHHPPYLAPEEQEEIKAIFKANHFTKRDRPGRGPALTQGLLRCAWCEDRLVVCYHRNKSYSYGCGWKTLQYAEKPCTRFISYDFDQTIVREVFKILKAPPLDTLKDALEESRRQKRLRLSWIEAERIRLNHERRRTEEFVDRSSPEHPYVYKHALDKLEMILKEQEEFERNVAIELSKVNKDETEEELEELCKLASDVPGLWHHPAVTHLERKEILRCVIDKIVVVATKERIDANITWKSGQETPIVIWRGLGRYNLVRELHSEKLTIPEMKERLENGLTSTGQSVKITVGRLYIIHQKLGLKPNRNPAARESLRHEAAKLSDQGYSMKCIAANFNDRGIKSPSGKPWTNKRIFSLVRALRKKPHAMREVHRKAISEALELGLKYREIAIELNKKGIPRRDGQSWTAKAVKRRWNEIKTPRKLTIKKENIVVEESTPA